MPKNKEAWHGTIFYIVISLPPDPSHAGKECNAESWQDSIHYLITIKDQGMPCYVGAWIRVNALVLFKL